MLQSEETVIYVGDDKVKQGGVAITMNAKAKRALMEWTQISKRIDLKHTMTVMQVYAPTNYAIDEEKDKCYYQLQDTLSSCNKYNMTVVIGELHAKM
uniref:Uncharacterized protein n=1 Tax=Anguilla anguilla TaxID=7936 RepID=A0A0E9XDV1_ANGAN